MARRRVEAPVGDGHDDVIAWYREELDKPAVVPWVSSAWEPVTVGPTWRVDGGRWVLPDASLGWDMLGWWGTHLQHKGQPWRCTLEQARWVLWWYAVDEAGRFVYRDGVLQRLKGWGKDPLGGCLLYGEALGPCRFAEWDGDRPVATDVEDAWVQTAATALEQTKNTMRLMPGLITPEARKKYRVQVGKELIHAMGDQRLIQAVTSSPSTLEGARATFVLRNETHLWLANNGGHEMAAVIDRNATKAADGAARALSITNAYQDGEDSVAQRDREAYDLAAGGGSLTTGIMYDSVEAPPEAPLTAEAAPDVVEAVRGDAVWLSTDRIVQAILDTRNPPSRSRRFWYNQIWAAEDAWCVPQDFDVLAAPDLDAAGDEVALFFDGSKSNDATGVVGCRISDGHVVTVGMWQAPPGEAGKGWRVDRDKVDQAVTAAFSAFEVVALFGDPSHALEDETEERYWDGLLDEWHRRWGSQLRVWAQPGARGHAVMWDMASPERTKEFTAAAERTQAEIREAAEAVRDGRPATFTHDGDGRLRRHVHAAKARPNRYGVSLGKESRESSRKVDLAVCMVGARMVRRMVLNSPSKKRQRTGRVW